MLAVEVEEEPNVDVVKASPRGESTEIVTEETPSVNVSSSNSFRADDILRSKLSTEDSSPLPFSLPTLPPKPLPTKETPTSLKSPNFPQIRPPAFCPLVSLKHITPFEHSEKPVFRSRESSAPPSRIESKTPKSPLPPQNDSLERLKKQEETKSANISQSNYPPSIYSWDSSQRPQFHSVSIYPENLRTNGMSPLKNGTLEQLNLLSPPPPTLYYDPYTGQYIPGPDYRVYGRYATVGGRRHRSRKRNRSHRSVGNYSTYDRTRSTSVMSSYNSEPPYPTIDQRYRADIQFQQPHLISHVLHTQPPIMLTSQGALPVYPQMKESVYDAYNNKCQLVSSGTSDSPTEFTETIIRRTPVRPNNFHPVGKTITTPLYKEPSYNSESASYRPTAQPPSQVPIPIKLAHEERPIRYTSDVVRSINRMTYKIGQKAPQSPRDHYLEVINNVSPKLTPKGRTEYSNGCSYGGGERRPSVKDLVKKFSIYNDEDVFVDNSRSDKNGKMEVI